MKKLILLITALILTLGSCATPAPPKSALITAPPYTEPRSAAPDFGFRRNVDALSYSDITYTEWQLPQLTPQAEKPRTLLIYMNGSDLESETAAATDDLRELRASGFDEDNLNVVIFTGGANRWHTRAVSNTKCELFELKNGNLSQIATVGDYDMGNAGTLASFIKFGLKSYPAAATSLILWDHGGGSIAGYGADERFDNSALTLRELEYAFAQAGLAQTPLELLGFDACLMATVETAVIAAPYARLLLASESLEPGDGWDYRAVREFSDPNATAEAIAISMAESFIASCGTNPTEEIAISVTRTDRAANVMGALGNLAAQASPELINGNFAHLTAARRNTKAFGDSAPDDAFCDMIDIASFANHFAAHYPEASNGVLDALAEAVIFNAYNSDTPLGGLSAYHAFRGVRDAQYTLAVYADLQMSAAYTRYLVDFSNALMHSPTEVYEPAPHLTSELFGKRTNFYAVSHPKNGTLCAARCTVNDEPAEALLYVAEDGTQHLLGYRKQDGFLMQKGYDKFKPNDIVHPAS